MSAQKWGTSSKRLFISLKPTLHFFSQSSFPLVHFHSAFPYLSRFISLLSFSCFRSYVKLVGIAWMQFLTLGAGWWLLLCFFYLWGFSQWSHLLMGIMGVGIMLVPPSMEELMLLAQWVCMATFFSKFCISFRSSLDWDACCIELMQYFEHLSNFKIY